MDSSEVATLILRFRDLVTDPGGTVRLHQEILAKRGGRPALMGCQRRGEMTYQEIAMGDFEADLVVNPDSISGTAPSIRPPSLRPNVTRRPTE